MRRHRRVRKKVLGSGERPRLTLHRSHLHLEAQLVDDISGKTLATCSTRQKAFRKSSGKGGGLEGARQLGVLVAEEALKQGIKQLVFDRGGYPYHGRVKALADSVRSKGLEF